MYNLLILLFIIIHNHFFISCHATTVCIQKRDPRSILEMKNVFANSLGQAMESKIHAIYASWAAHVVPLAWAANDEHNISTTSNNNYKQEEFVGRQTKKKLTLRTDIFSFSSSSSIINNQLNQGPITMTDADYEMVNIQMTSLYNNCAYRDFWDTRKCPKYLRSITENYQRHLSVSDKLNNIFTNHTLNILIAGAGPVGLILANAIASTFSTNDVRVVVIENRVFANGTKRPYTRKWPTDIQYHLFEEALKSNPEINSIFRSLSVRCVHQYCDLYTENHQAEIGNKYNLRTDMNMMETALLLSCRKLGVRFLYRKDPDYTCKKNNIDDTITDVGKLSCEAHLRIDATGNRLQPFNKRHFIESKNWSPDDLVQLSSRLPLSYIPAGGAAGGAVFNTPMYISHKDFLFPVSARGDGMYKYIVPIYIYCIYYERNQTNKTNTTIPA